MIERARTVAGFARRPRFWAHMLAFAWRKFDGSQNHECAAAEAQEWAAKRAVSGITALKQVGAITHEPSPAGLDPRIVAEGRKRAIKSLSQMGGPGDLNLIHRAILALDAKRVVETGVAYGWSSLSALHALRLTGGRLVSVDMPYPKLGNERDVGIVVPELWRDRWVLIREPDRHGLRKALNYLGGEIDVAHFDRDKSYPGRMYAYSLMWDALRPGGLLISDDIQDNFGFRDFAENLHLPFAVTQSDGKFVGLVAKPQASGWGESSQ